MDSKRAMGTALNLTAALVSFSGGQDSTTALAWALSRYENVETVGFRYGQKHLIEMERRPVIREAIVELVPDWKKRLGPDHIIDLDLIGQIAGKSIASPPNHVLIAGEGFAAGSLNSRPEFDHAVHVRKCGVPKGHTHAGLWDKRNGIFGISRLPKRVDECG